MYDTIHGTKRDAEAALAEMLVAANNNSLIKPKAGLTFAAYLLRWIEDYGKANWRNSTLRGNRGIIENHIIPVVGNVLLTKLQPIHLQNYLGSKLKDGLSRTYVLLHHRIIKEALKHAVEWELVSRNVAQAVKPPKKGEYEAETLNAKDALTLLEKAKNTLLYIPILLAIAKCMRRGEILALHWREIDLKRGVLSIISITCIVVMTGNWFSVSPRPGRVSGRSSCPVMSSRRFKSTRPSRMRSG